MMAHPVSRALDAARRLTARGWVVFPADHPDRADHCLGSARECLERRCKAAKDHAQRGKHPAVGRWGSLTGPADESTLAAWFAGDQYNVALAAGPSGLLIVDDDRRGGFERYAASIGEAVPKTFRVRTHQGWHHYFTVPVDPATGERVPVGNAPGLLKEWGCDVRGGAGRSGGVGGYVIAPGSVHWSADPDAYTVSDWSAEAIEAPGWLIHAVTTEPTVTPGGGVAGRDGEASGTGHGPGAGRRPYDDDPRPGTVADLTAQWSRHCAEVIHEGGAFRHELFLAARDGWRLVELELLEQAAMLDALEVCVRRVWDAPPDSNDLKIIHAEALHGPHGALVSPWVIREAPVTERVPEPAPDRWGGWQRPWSARLPDTPGDAVTSGDAAGDGVTDHTPDGNRTVSAVDGESPASVDSDGSTAVERVHRAKVAERLDFLRVDQEARATLAARGLPPLEPRSYLDFRATTKPSYLIPRMLYRNGLAVVFGAPGSGKSYLMLDIALSYATGSLWQGHRVTNPDGSPGMTHYVMAEGLDINLGRAEAWEHYHGIAPEAIEGRFVVFENGIQLSEPGIAQYLVHVRRDKPDLIILDTRNALFVGKESSGEDYGLMINVLNIIRRAAEGCAVVLLDHSGLNDPDRPRGSNALIAGVHTAIQVSKGKDRDAGIYTARETGRNKGAEDKDAPVWSWRLRKIEDVPHEGLDAPAVCVPLDADDEIARRPIEIVGAWWDDVEVPDDLLKIKGRGRQMAQHVFRVLRWVGGDAGLTRDELSRTITRFLRMHDAKAAGCTPDQLGRALSLLTDAGVIEHAGRAQSRFVLTPGYRPTDGHGQPPG
jgi:hypothetical protein